MLAPALIISLSVGTALGQRYRVFVLAPVFGLALLLGAAVALTHPEAAWRVTETTLAAILGLQVGFVLGIVLRHVALLVRANRMAPLPMRGAPSRRPAR